MRTAKLGVVGVMMIVRTAPNAAGAQGEDAKYSHQHLSQPRTRQDRLMLLVVVDYKKPEQQQPCQQTANHAAREMKVPDCPRHGGGEKECGGQKVPPTPCRRIHRVQFGCQYDLFSCSYGWHDAVEFRQFAYVCPKGKYRKISPRWQRPSEGEAPARREPGSTAAQTRRSALRSAAASYEAFAGFLHLFDNSRRREGHD